MDYNTFRNTMREWVRTKVASSDKLKLLDLVVPNETSSHGVDANYIRYSLQTGDAAVIGVGSAIKRRRRLGRVYIEIFAAIGEGEGLVSQQATAMEAILREASETATRIHDDITVFEPSTFERPEGGRYCQVVTAPIQVDDFS